MTHVNDYSSTEALIAKFGIKPKCSHPKTTLVQHIDEEFGWFAAYQCDRCGIITRQVVTPDDLDSANDAPWLDVALYELAVTEKVPGETSMKALVFFERAAR